MHQCTCIRIEKIGKEDKSVESPVVDSFDSRSRKGRRDVTRFGDARLRKFSLLQENKIAHHEFLVQRDLV